ncbi:uncharacterized protein CDAR_451601 [Caerostris darwini]|uniref:Gustatory receptor n=1 Tax=Caerostris darwini TaxID=1538125 RepID=A0AAV4UJQ2_9ARAC|nr:uncharacterized protein CDAR_451601 [Caerostris darwini]
MHQAIEDVLQISAFLAYVLVFTNFLVLALLNTTDFSEFQIMFRVSMCVIMFLWTMSNFMMLTLTGSKLVDICKMWKLLQMDILKNNAKRKARRSDEFKYLLLFIKSSQLDLTFTGGGMFQLQRSLLLTMGSAILSYSVLAVTF